MEIPHELSADQARERIQRKGEFLQDKFQGQVKDMTTSWEGNTLSFGFKTMGLRFDGTVDVQDNRVIVAGDLPFAMMMLKGRIESEIREQLQKTLKV